MPFLEISPDASIWATMLAGEPDPEAHAVETGFQVAFDDERGLQGFGAAVFKSRKDIIHGHDIFFTILILKLGFQKAHHELMAVSPRSLWPCTEARRREGPGVSRAARKCYQAGPAQGVAAGLQNAGRHAQKIGVECGIAVGDGSSSPRPGNRIVWIMSVSCCWSAGTFELFCRPG